MMTRNTEKRVEVACPVLDEDVRRQINHYLKIMLTDNVKARVLNADGDYEKKELTEPLIDSQAVFMQEALNVKRKAPERRQTFLERIRHLFGK